MEMSWIIEAAACSDDEFKLIRDQSTHFVAQSVATEIRFNSFSTPQSLLLLLLIEFKIQIPIGA